MPEMEELRRMINELRDNVRDTNYHLKTIIQNHEVKSEQLNETLRDLQTTIKETKSTGLLKEKYSSKEILQIIIGLLIVGIIIGSTQGVAADLLKLVIK